MVCPAVRPCISHALDKWFLANSSCIPHFFFRKMWHSTWKKLVLHMTRQSSSCRQAATMSSTKFAPYLYRYILSAVIIKPRMRFNVGAYIHRTCIVNTNSSKSGWWPARRTWKVSPNSSCLGASLVCIFQWSRVNMSHWYWSFLSPRQSLPAQASYLKSKRRSRPFNFCVRR